MNTEKYVIANGQGSISDHNGRKVAVVLAAGKGTRMKTEKPKVAVELNGKPLILHVIKNLRQAGVDDIILIVGYKKDEVIAICKEFIGIRFVEQREQLGTAHALQCAEGELKDYQGTIIVTAGDAPLISAATFAKLENYHKAQKLEATVLSAKMNNPFGYGRIIRNEEKLVEAIVEEKDATDDEKKIIEINTGTYCFNSPRVFQFLKKIGNENAQREYYLPDLIKIYKKELLSVGALSLENSFESHGVNSMEDLEKVSTFLKDGKVKT